MTSSKLAILAIGAHPDDIEICCGGLVAKMTAAGHIVGILDLTKGELGSRGTPKTREEEATKAREILGVQVRENLGFPDGQVGESGSMSREQQLSKVVAAIRKFRPEVILAPYFEERHPDHVGASNLITRAVFLAALPKFESSKDLPPFTPNQLIYYQMRYLVTPSFVVDISSTFTTKMDAIKAFGSQLGLSPAQAADPKSEETKTLLSSSLSYPSFEARDRFYGAMIGVEYGEPYIVRNQLGIADPVAHFRQYPGTRSLFSTL